MKALLPVMVLLSHAHADVVWDKGWLNYIESDINKQSPYSKIECVTLVETLHHCTISMHTDNPIQYYEDIQYDIMDLHDYSMVRATGMGYYPYIITLKE
jgi:hypothetical protein